MIHPMAQALTSRKKAPVAIAWAEPDLESRVEAEAEQAVGFADFENDFRSVGKLDFPKELLHQYGPAVVLQEDLSRFANAEALL